MEMFRKQPNPQDAGMDMTKLLPLQAPGKEATADQQSATPAATPVAAPSAAIPGAVPSGLGPRQPQAMTDTLTQMRGALAAAPQAPQVPQPKPMPTSQPAI